jgi:hypothetical protein
MEKLILAATKITPEIQLSVDDNIFRISGASRPEDVRSLYHPVVEWVKELADNITDGKILTFSPENPLKFQFDLMYFNSSSAKFIYDIVCELKRIAESSIPLIVEWYYETEDTDMLEAGNDMASLAEMEFNYVVKK